MCLMKQSNYIECFAKLCFCLPPALRLRSEEAPGVGKRHSIAVVKWFFKKKIFSEGPVLKFTTLPPKPKILTLRHYFFGQVLYIPATTDLAALGLPRCLFGHLRLKMGGFLVVLGSMTFSGEYEFNIKIICPYLCL